jgi:ADP-heptose:LPS heptosyltransferase
VPRPRELRPRHSVENQWDLLRALDFPNPSRSTYPVEMPVDPTAARNVRERLVRAGIASTERLIVVHVSAGNPFRRWPTESFAALVRRLAAAEPARRIVVTSGPSDAEAAGRVIAAARSGLDNGSRERVVSCGDFSLPELRALLDRASLYIGGDSGPLHVAAATRIPIVGLYGPTLPARSEPWRGADSVAQAVEVPDLPCRPCDQRVCVPGDFRCLAWIRPEQVVQAAERALRYAE